MFSAFFGFPIPSLPTTSFTCHLPVKTSGYPALMPLSVIARPGVKADILRFPFRLTPRELLWFHRFLFCSYTMPAGFIPVRQASSPLLAFTTTPSRCATSPAQTRFGSDRNAVISSPHTWFLWVPESLILYPVGPKSAEHQPDPTAR